MDNELVALLRDRARTATPTQLIELLGTMLGSPVSAGQMIVTFKLAFPKIPLKVLLDMGAWNRFVPHGVSDSEFDATLGPWISRDLRGE